MTVFELAFRSMRQNVKLYYLYFFALIFSMSLYFIFASLQHDQAVQNMADSSVSFYSAFQAAGILLIVIAGIFTFSANGIFLRRRSREIGLYQLIGLTKNWIVRYLLIENIMLGLGALIAGLISGTLLTRLFVLILMNLLGLEGVPAITFSFPAALNTGLVFLFIIITTSVQMIMTVYRSSLLSLFQADKQPDLSSKPRAVTTTIFASLGLGLIGYGYKLSGDIMNDQLVLNVFLVLISIVTGTYLFYRVTIRWCFYWLRRRKNGHLGLMNSLSLAVLMHRMKQNANSLTLITLLSAMTITLVSMAYAFYYSAEQDTRLQLPYDFKFENEQQNSSSFKKELEGKGIQFRHDTVKAIRTLGIIHDPHDKTRNTEQKLLWFPAEQLKQAGAELNIPADGEALLYDAWATLQGEKDVKMKKFPTEVEMIREGQSDYYTLNTLVVDNLMNFDVSGAQLLVSEATMTEIGQHMTESPGYEDVHFDVYTVPDKKELAEASSLYAKYAPDDNGPYVYDFYTQYQEALQFFGLLIFISAFLGLVFLISTGSILYFKQMTEAEQEKPSFRTLRQLGFDEKMIMSGIARKQVIVFLLPLSIGLLHSIFAVKAASFMVISDITLPAGIAMGAYTIIYFIFAACTMGYYRKVVKNAMV